MRPINIVLDLYSAAVCLILVCYLRFGGGRNDKMRQFFIWMCAINLGMAVGDIPNWAFEGLARSWYPAVLWSGSLLFWICSSLMPLAFTYYLVEYLAPRARVHRFFRRSASVLCAAAVLGSVLSVWNGMFFTVTQENVYQRGNWFWLSQTLPFLMYALDVAIFAVYRRSLNRKDFRILSSYIILPLAAEVVQMLNYGVALLNTGVALGLLIIFINIQSEQELRIERQEKELAQQRMDIMLSQIQPHFLYNSLTAIRRLCDHDPQQAKVAITDFSLFLRANMDSLASRAPIPFEQELSHTRHYLALEQQRFQARLQVVYDIRCQDFSLPPLALQPIVENAVRHGVLRREEGGTVTIRTAETAAAYIVVIADDGVGIQPIGAAEGRSHIGIENVRSRLSVLCGGTLEIKSETGMGTTVTITVPKEEEMP